MSLETFVRNLTNVAPNKGEAKKTVSQGLIRVSFGMDDELEWWMEGHATDDVMAIFQKEPISRDQFERMTSATQVDQFEWVGYYLPDTLKSWLYYNKLDYNTTRPDSSYDREFDSKFWLDHVDSSILGPAGHPSVGWVEMNPDRLRKFSLLEPRGQVLRWEFREWADQTVIRWTYGVAHGVYAPIDVMER